MIRDALREIIEPEPDLVVSDLAGSATEALAALERTRPDIVILDLCLLDADGTHLIREILDRSRRTRVLVLSMYEEATYAERCLRAGARGYVNKRTAGLDVRHAIRVVAEGGLYLSEAMRRKLAPASPAGRSGGLEEFGPDALSDRELEVFQLLGRGNGPSQIAEAMGISVRTVEGYESRIKKKLELIDAGAVHTFAVAWFRGASR